MTVIRHIFSTIRHQLQRLLHSPASSDLQPRPETKLLRDEELRVRGLSQALSSELFAHLLMELPAYRTDLSGFYRNGDIGRLAQCTHKLLGAVVYCDTPELSDGLKNLQQAMRTGDAGSIDIAYTRAINIIDNTLANSGLR